MLSLKEVIALSEQSQNKMGTMPVNKLLLSMALPMMASMLVQALYNIVDSMFVAKISEDALSAVSLAFPVQTFMIAIGSGIGVGMNAYLSRSLGENNMRNVNRAAANGIFLVLVSSIIFIIFGLFFVKMFFESQAPGNEVVIGYGVDYLTICSTFSVALFCQMTFERLLQSTGKTFYTMITQGMGAIINIILDPILIFGYLGFPKLGVAGAALATIIGQACAMVLAIYFNLTKNKEIKLRFKRFRPHLETIKVIFAVGVPSILMMSIGSIMVFGVNKILTGFSLTAVAVFGVYFKLQSFIFMPIFGMNNGMIPIVAYNYGAVKKDRIIKTIKLSVIYAISIMIVGFIIFQFFSGELLDIFDASAEMKDMGITALKTISLSFIPAGFCIIMGSVFQAFGKGVLSLIISVIRQLVVLLPAAYVLSLFCEGSNVDLIWFAFPLAEIASVIFSTIFIFRVYKNVIKPMDNMKSVEQEVV